MQIMSQLDAKSRVAPFQPRIAAFVGIVPQAARCLNVPQPRLVSFCGTVQFGMDTRTVNF